jgi:hypothetical protein
MTSVSTRLRKSVVAVAMLIAITGGACDDASTGGDDPSNDSRFTFGDGLPVVMSLRVVCRLASDTPSAVAATITGADGTQSIAAGERSYWFFGDTVRKAGERQDVIPAAVATTTDKDASDCLDLQFKTTPDGIVTPMFPRLDETTAWPDGVLLLDDGSIAFYMVKALRQSPFAWHVGSVGLGRIPEGSVDGERVVEAIWDEQSGFGTRVAGARSPLRLGDDVIVYLLLDDHRNVIARAPIARMGEFTAYAYWDGDGWSGDPANAVAMWTSDEDGFPPDNGVQVSFDEDTGRWMAVYNDRMASVKVRLADEPWGPWSDPVSWFDCRPLVQDVYPYCYTGELHRHLTRGEGPLYMTISSQKPYDVTLIEVHMANAIHAWRSGAGVVRYSATAPGGDFEDAGVAFYASTTPAPGLSPVFEERAGDGYGYSVAAHEGGGEPAFYAYSTAPDGAITTVAVRELHGELAAGGDGEVRFFVPCPTVACEQSSAVE